MLDSLAAELFEVVADRTRVFTAPAVLDRLSHDFYWYSPVLRPLLAAKNGDVAVQPVNVDEVLALLRFAGMHEIPVTVRGAGTGNYGQCVPLEGGIVLDLALMDKLEEITPDGVAVCQPGLRLGMLETEARKRGWELRMYPSTLVKASVGGFLAGGSGGIGSVAHGGLRDFDNVRAFEVVTMEETPRVVLHEGAAVHEILHAWGTNGVLTRIWFALAPAVEWTQLTAAFDTYEQAFTFTETIAVDAAWTKRLATVFEWPIPSFFTPVKHMVRADKTLVLIMIATAQLDSLRAAVAAAGGEVTFAGPYDGSAHAAAAERLHVEPHHLVGHEGRSGVHIFAVRIFAGGLPGAVSASARTLRPGDSVSHRIHEERRRRRHSRRNSSRAFYYRRAVERHDRVLPVDRRLCGQSARELP